MYSSKYEHQNKGENYDYRESYYENEKCTKKNEYLPVSNLENNYETGDDSSHADHAIKNEYEDFNYELKNDICNRENQWYALYYNILNWFLEITLNTIYCIVVTCLQAVSRKAPNL